MTSRFSQESGTMPSVSPADVGRAGSLPLPSSTPELMTVSPIGSQSQTPVNSKALDEALKRREWLQSQKSQLLSQITALQSGMLTFMNSCHFIAVKNCRR